MPALIRIWTSAARFSGRSRKTLRVASTISTSVATAANLVVVAEGSVGEDGFVRAGPAQTAAPTEAATESVEATSTPVTSPTEAPSATPDAPET